MINLDYGHKWMLKGWDSMNMFVNYNKYAYVNFSVCTTTG